MPRSRALRSCFCRICKGNVSQSKSKRDQHEKIYGLSRNCENINVSTEHGYDAINDSSSEEDAEFLQPVADDHDDTNEDTIGQNFKENVNACVSTLSDFDDEGNITKLEEFTGDVLDDSTDDKTTKILEEYMEDVLPVPANDEQADSDSDDISSTCSSESDQESDDEGPIAPNFNVNDADERLPNSMLLEAMRESPPLYPGSTCSLFDTLVHLFEWFSSHPSISKETFSKSLEFWNTVLPQGNCLPTTYRKAFKVVKPFLLPEVVYHVCPKECIIYRGEYKNHTICPKCQEPRFKDSKMKQPWKTFHYLPIGPRLVRSFGCKDISYLLQCHGGDCQQDSDDVMTDIHHSTTWKKSYSKSGTFGKDPRGMGLSLCLDGLNPWSKNKTTYSMWPIVLSQLNLPRNIRYQPANLWLLGIIPSQKDGCETENLDPYMEVLIDEIIELSNCKLYDDYKKAPFNVKVRVMLYVVDYQGLGKVFALTGTGSYRACAWCMFKGIYCKHLNKVVYPGNRRFLPSGHTLRKDCTNFPDQKHEERDRPPKRTFKCDKDFHTAYDNAKNASQATKLATGTGCRGMYAIAKKMPEFDRVEQCVPDAMHTIAVQMKHLCRLLSGKAPEDSTAVRLQEMELNRFPETWPTTNSATSSSSKLPDAPFVLSKTHIQEADRRISEVVVPAGESYRPRPIFSKMSRLNSHEWKEIAVRGILKYCVRGMLQEEQSKALNLFTDSIAAICSPCQDSSKLQQLKEKVDLALVLMEGAFPLSFQVVTNHILHHIVEGIEKYGPVYSTWMFSFERFNSWLCRRALSRKDPEATILRTYQIFEWCHFMKMSGYMKGSLPLCLPSSTLGDNEVTCSQPPTFELADEDLKYMEHMYINEVPELKELHNLFQLEKKKARDQRRLKQFPKSMSHWKPERGQLNQQSHTALNSLHEGLQSSAKRYHHLSTMYSSCDYLYISKSHPKKRPSIICVTEKMRFGVIENIFKHSFSSQDYTWAAVNLFVGNKFVSQCSLWCAENSVQERVLVLLHKVSHPLTVAYDDSNTIWFLDTP